MRLLFSVLLTITVSEALPGTRLDVARNDGVSALNNDNFQDFIDDNDLVLVMFHAKWYVDKPSEPQP